MKFAIHDGMLEKNLTDTSLGEKLGVSEIAVRRLRNPLHKSKTSNVVKALHVLGLQAGLTIVSTGKLLEKGQEMIKNCDKNQDSFYQLQM